MGGSADGGGKEETEREEMARRGDVAGEVPVGWRGCPWLSPAEDVPPRFQTLSSSAAWPSAVVGVGSVAASSFVEEVVEEEEEYEKVYDAEYESERLPEPVEERGVDARKEEEEEEEVDRVEFATAAMAVVAGTESEGETSTSSSVVEGNATLACGMEEEEREGVSLSFFERGGAVTGGPPFRREGEEWKEGETAGERPPPTPSPDAFPFPWPRHGWRAGNPAHPCDGEREAGEGRRDGEVALACCCCCRRTRRW